MTFLDLTEGDELAVVVVELHVDPRHTRSLLTFRGMPHTHVVSPYLTHAGGAAMSRGGCLTQHPPRPECLYTRHALSCSIERVAVGG